MKLGICAMIVVVIFMCMACYVYCFFCEKHAKAVLVDISQSVDGQFDDSGCLKDYYRSIEICDWIEHYYPLDAVLPAWHPFANKYHETRVAQINRIHSKLVEKFGVDCGYKWNEWRRYIYDKSSPSTNTTR